MESRSHSKLYFSLIFLKQSKLSINFEKIKYVEF